MLGTEGEAVSLGAETVKDTAGLGTSTTDESGEFDFCFGEKGAGVARLAGTGVETLGMGTGLKGSEVWQSPGTESGE